MITIENELQARDEFYNLAYILLTEEEKTMPKYEALKSVLERCLQREETARIANMTQALATFWENVANLFKIKTNWEVLATMSLNDVLLHNFRRNE